MAEWVSAIDAGGYTGLDEVLAARGIDDASVARLHMDRWHWKRGSEEDKDSLLTTTDAASTISPSSSSVLASSPMSSPSTSSSRSFAGSCSARLQSPSELADLSTNSSSPEQILNSCPLSLPSSIHGCRDLQGRETRVAESHLLLQ